MSTHQLAGLARATALAALTSLKRRADLAGEDGGLVIVGVGATSGGSREGQGGEGRDDGEGELHGDGWMEWVLKKLWKEWKVLRWKWCGVWTLKWLWRVVEERSCGWGRIWLLISPLC